MKLGWLSPPSRNENDGFPFFRARSTARIPHRPVSMFINTLAFQRIKLANRLTKYEIMVSCILERFGRSACSALSSEKTLNAKTDREDGRTPSKPSAARRPLTIFENVRFLQRLALVSTLGSSARFPQELSFLEVRQAPSKIGF